LARSHLRSCAIEKTCSVSPAESHTNLGVSQNIVIVVVVSILVPIASAIVSDSIAQSSVADSTVPVYLSIQTPITNGLLICEVTGLVSMNRQQTVRLFLPVLPQAICLVLMPGSLLMEQMCTIYLEKSSSMDEYCANERRVFVRDVVYLACARHGRPDQL
jgi:hypothetical protein